MNKYLSKETEQIASESRLNCFNHIYQITKTNRVKAWLWAFLLILVIVLFLPWTQNVRARGTVNAQTGAAASTTECHYRGQHKEMVCKGRRFCESR